MTSGGYVGLSLAVLLAQHHQVTAVDIVPEKVELINNKKSPIQDDYIEKYLAEKELDLTATLDAKEAYSDADFVVIAAPTNYDSKKNFFDTSAVGRRNLRRVQPALRHLIDFITVQHQVGCESVMLVKKDVLILNGQKLVQGMQVHKQLMLKIMSEGIAAHHLLCLFVQLAILPLFGRSRRISGSSQKTLMRPS